MRAIFDFLRVIADSESNVLLIGETGTGKELTAHLIDHDSARRRRPFVTVSCAILNESPIESEPFGHERGSFTGAIKDRPGRFEMEEGGTIFLDDSDEKFRQDLQSLVATALTPSCETLEETGVASLDERLEEVESRLITWALTASHGNKSKAAKLLQIKRSTLGDGIRNLGLEEQGGES